MESVKSFIVKQISYKACKNFCNQWHYSKYCPPGKVYFGLFKIDVLIGVICYGLPAMRFQQECYNVDIELRRLCCIDDTPKYTESYFISKTLKVIKKLGYECVLSLADPNFNHSGIIYRASNFKYLGLEQGGGSRDIFIDGEKFHSRTAFAKFNVSGKKGLQKLLPNSHIDIRNKKRKHIYIYELNRRNNNCSYNNHYYDCCDLAEKLNSSDFADLIV